MRKKPYRPTGEITQPFNSGVLTVYDVTDGAKPGYQPKAVLQKRACLRFEERRLGIERYYAGKQNQIRVERVVRVPKIKDVHTQQVVVTNDDAKTPYRVELVQEAFDTYPPALDLTLVRFEQTFEVIA